MTGRKDAESGAAETTETAGVSRRTRKGTPGTGKNPRHTDDGPTPVSAGSLLGYARTSRADQNLDRQRDALTEAGCVQIFEDDGVSGMKTARAGLDALLVYARPGDTIVISALDRLGRRTIELLRLVKELKEREISLRILNLGVDSATVSGQLVLTVMASLAEMEREILVERTRDGLDAARRRGRVGGRPAALTPEQRAEVGRMIDDGRPLAEIARLMRVSDRTVRRVRDERPDGTSPTP